MVSKHTTPENYWVKIGNSEIRRNRTHLNLLEPYSILINSEEGRTLSEPLAEECGTDPTESEVSVDLNSESLSTKGEDLWGLGCTNQMNEGGLANSSNIVITKSGRHSRKPHRSDYLH